jgi:hypothetical protein
MPDSFVTSQLEMYLMSNALRMSINYEKGGIYLEVQFQNLPGETEKTRTQSCQYSSVT